MSMSESEIQERIKIMINALESIKNQKDLDICLFFIIDDNELEILSKKISDLYFSINRIYYDLQILPEEKKEEYYKKIRR